MSWIAIPPTVSTNLGSVSASVRRLETTLSGFTTLAALDLAEEETKRLSEQAKLIRLQIRNLRADEQRRLRAEEKATEAMLAQNARIISERAA